MRSRRKKSPARASSDESRTDKPAQQPTADYSRVADSPVGDSPVERADITPAEERIRMRAYELYLERGGAPGDEMEDWLRAEREIREQSGSGRPLDEPGQESRGI
jgi:Protein of unknown function (DUF2934)